MPRDNLITYTFGAPAVGNADFQFAFSDDENNYLTKRLNLHRVRNKLDIVPFASYAQYLQKYSSDIIAAYDKKQYATVTAAIASQFYKANLSTAELVFRNLTDNWPYVHIGNMVVYDNGADITGDYDEMGLFTSGPDILYASVKGDECGQWVPHHMMCRYKANLASATEKILSKSGLMNIQSTAAGSISSRSLNIIFNPDPADIGKTGNLYLVLLNQDGLYFVKSSGAIVKWDGNSVFDSFQTGTLARQILRFDKLDLTSLKGARVFLGYDTKLFFLTSEKTFRAVHYIQ